MYITCAGCGKKSHISTWVTIKKSSGNEATMSCPNCGRQVTVRV